VDSNLAILACLESVARQSQRMCKAYDFIEAYDLVKQLTMPFILGCEVKKVKQSYIKFVSSHSYSIIFLI